MQVPRSLIVVLGRRPYLVPAALALAVLVGAAAFLGGYVPYERAEIEDTWERVLASRSDVRRAAIEEWFRNESVEAAAIGSFPMVVEALARGRARPDDHVTRVLSAYADAHGYLGILVLGGDGRPVAVVPRTAPADSVVLAAARAVLARPDLNGDLVRCGCGRPVIVVATALPAAGPAGAVVLLADPAAWLYPFLARANHDPSAEALLVREDGGRVVFASPLRFDTTPPFGETRSVDTADLPAARAMAGQRAVGPGRDYRGADVIAATAMVAGTRLGLVLKVDHADAFAGFGRRMALQGLLWAVLVAAVAVAILVLWWGLRHAVTSATVRDRAQFARLLDHAHDAILVYGEDARVRDCNARAAQLYECSREELIGLHAITDLRPPEEVAAAEAVRRRLESGKATLLETVHLTRRGERIPVEVSSRPVEVDGTRVVVAVVRDVRERRAAEVRERRLNRMLRTLSEVNQLIVRADDPQNLLEQACEALVTHGGFELAWIGRLGDDGGVPVTARAGAVGYLEGIEVRWDEGPLAQGPTGRAAREQRIVLSDFAVDPGFAPWRATAARFGLAASVAAPMVHDGRAWGVLSLYARSAALFDPELMALIQELAGDLAFALDGLERNRALAESEARLQAFFESGVIGILFGDVHGNILDANDELLRLIDYSREELDAGQARWLDMTPPEWLAADERGLAEAREFGACTPYEKEYVRRDGSRVPIMVGYTLLPPERERLVAFVLDLSRVKAMEAEAARGAAALRQAAEAAIITDARGDIVDVNPAFERITGYRKAEVLGKNPRLLKSGRQDEAFYRAMWARLAAGEVFTGEVVNRKKDGTTYTAEVAISPVRGADGRIVNFVGLQRDVTRERELDLRLNQSQRAEALGQLTGGIAHDFNNLLTVILSNLSLVEGDLPPEAAAVRPFLKDLGEAARHGSALVRKLLAFGRRSRLSLTTVDLDELVGSAARLLRRVIPESIEVRAVPRTGLPAVRADLGAVEQMLLNLATNARDAMPGGGTLTIGAESITVDAAEAASAGGSPAGPYVAITVEDTGTGMSREVVAHAFEPFFTTKPVGQGSGLGLAMIFGLMRQHRGFVRLASEEGRGTRIQLCFPVTTSVPEPDAPAAARPVAAPMPRGDETLLVVEDEPALRLAAQRTLERLGYTVLTAGNGEEGWDVFQAERARIGLVISDAVMPRLGGLDLLKRLRSAGAGVPFVLSSGYADGGAGDSLGDGSVPLLPKPWMPADLARLVRHLLDQAAPAGAARP